MQICEEENNLDKDSESYTCDFESIYTNKDSENEINKIIEFLSSKLNNELMDTCVIYIFFKLFFELLIKMRE